jgi:predicted phage baseplate assembly protein
MAKRCGCSTSTCGCCEGVHIVTPVVPDNRPGLPAISYRAGTYAQFFETMKARISSITVDEHDAPARPLAGLTTRDPSDPAIALLDSWATVGDVLTFYQERIANEGYLRTATERRSVLELSRLVGYEPRPGVAASVYLAYTLDDNQVEPVLIAPGTRSQSIPLTGSTDLPQSFETSDALTARREWNDLQVRTHYPRDISLVNALAVDAITVKGANTNIKTGDQILLVFGTQSPTYVVRTVQSLDPDFTAGTTVIHLLIPDAFTAAAAPLLAAFVAALMPLIDPKNPADGLASSSASATLTAVYLGSTVPQATQIATTLKNAAFTSNENELATIGNPSPAVQALIANLLVKLTELQGAGSNGGTVKPPTLLGAVTQLTVPKFAQPATSLQLSRSLATALQKGSDAHSQLLVNAVPEINDSLYQAAASLGASQATPALQSAQVFRFSGSLFGSAVQDRILYKINATDRNESDPIPQPTPVDGGELTNAVFLDQAHEAALPNTFALIQKPGSGPDPVRSVHRVTAAQTGQRSAYGISGKTTKLTFADNWWFGIQDNISTMRGAYVGAQTEPLTLIDQNDSSDVTGTEIQLDRLYRELTSGRWVIFSGERTDIPGVKGVTGVELLMISGLRHGYSGATALPNEQLHTTLLLATGTKYSYKRDSLTVYGNVVKATHGETRPEILGSGDASQSLQSFTLRQPPLTYVSAPTVSGVESTLQVYVNNIEWHEADTLAGALPKDRKFITQTDEHAVTAVIFGNGAQGSRLFTGVQNVQAIYRNGIGLPGNVKAGQISQMQTRPLGAKAVINPLAASGGADKESRDLARANAPLAVTALDRLVSVQDFADFTRTFAAIAKADARAISNGRQQLVHVTVAGAADIRIDPQSDLYRNLLLSLRKAGDPNTPFQVDARELIALILSVKVKINSDYLWDPVATQINATLLDLFGFDKRALGHDALLCEIITAIQNVPGVVYADVVGFGGIPERKVIPGIGGKPATSVLLMPDDIAAVAKGIFAASREKKLPPERVAAGIARLDHGILRPAQIALFTPSVPDTIALNQIL